MNPPVIFVQAVLAATVIAGLVRAGYPDVGHTFAWAAFGLSLLLAALNWQWRKQLRFRQHRLLVDVSWLLLLVPVFINGAGRRLAEGDHETTVAALLILGSVALVTMLLSSLVDWYYVLPRMAGPWRPCVMSLDPRLGLVTRLWIAHRLAAALAVVAGAVAIVGLAANAWVEQLNEVVAAAVAAAASVLAGFYLTRFAPALAMAVNPALHLGDKIQLAEQFNLPTENAPTYYVAEVAIEGVKLLQLDERDYPMRPEIARRHDRVLDLSDVGKLLFSRDRVSPCHETCKGLNPRCGRRAGSRLVNAGDRA